MIQFTLYSRSYCHLCDDMLEHLRPYQSEHGFEIAVVDVDADEALVALYDELVPVLIAQREGEEAQQICHYFLDHDQLKAYLHG
jgi:thiol-disulfide isomerase/thioredoxin